MGDNYKDAKEAFVSDMTGSTISHINLISLVALVRQCKFFQRFNIANLYESAQLPYTQLWLRVFRPQNPLTSRQHG